MSEDWRVYVQHVERCKKSPKSHLFLPRLFQLLKLLAEEQSTRAMNEPEASARITSEGSISQLNLFSSVCW
jgi:hypothetical protein